MNKLTISTALHTAQWVMIFGEQRLIDAWEILSDNEYSKARDKIVSELKRRGTI